MCHSTTMISYSARTGIVERPGCPSSGFSEILLDEPHLADGQFLPPVELPAVLGEQRVEFRTVMYPVREPAAGCTGRGVREVLQRQLCSFHGRK